MDDGNSEYTKGDQSLRQRDWYEVVGEKQEADSRDKVYNDKGAWWMRERVSTDEERVFQ